MGIRIGRIGRRILMVEAILTVVFLLFFIISILVSLIKYASASTSTVTLTWEDNSEGEDGFQIERRIGKRGSFSVVGTVGPNETSFVDDTLDPTKVYYFRVKAFNEIGFSLPTNLAIVEFEDSVVSGVPVGECVKELVSFSYTCGN